MSRVIQFGQNSKGVFVPQFGQVKRKGMGNIFDDISSFVTTKVTPLVNSGTQLYTQGQAIANQVNPPNQPSNNAPAQTNNNVSANPISAATGLTTAEMVGIGLGVLGLGATLYFATKK